MNDRLRRLASEAYDLARELERSFRAEQTGARARLVLPMDLHP